MYQSSSHCARETLRALLRISPYRVYGDRASELEGAELFVFLIPYFEASSSSTSSNWAPCTVTLVYALSAFSAHSFGD
jgi:hypothetical protein